MLEVLFSLEVEGPMEPSDVYGAIMYSTEGLPCEGADLRRLVVLGLAKLKVEGIKGEVKVRLLSRLNL